MIYPKNSVILAPLSGFTDLPYRRSARRHGCVYAFTEMVDAGSLVYRNFRTMKMLKRGEEEAWLGLQLIAADKDILKKATQIVNEKNFDVIDFNLGCPAPKVVKKGEGAALGEKIDKAVSVFEVLVRTSQIPVTVKIRILDEENPAPTVELASKLCDAGAQAITVHGRVRTKFYAGPVYHDVISAVREAVTCPLIANGSVFDFESFCEIRKNTGCDSVMVARGAMGNPWLFDELLMGLKEEDNGSVLWQPPNAREFADEIFMHISEMVEFYGLELGLTIARKVILDYMRGRGFARVLKTHVIEIASIDDLKQFTECLAEGPTERYMLWLEKHETAVRRLRR